MTHTRLALATLVALAFALRSLGAGEIFGGDGEVFLGKGDSAYHARRAQFSFVNFPSVLYRDPYLAYPDGAPVPWPPLYDWLLAAAARLFGDSLAVFERVAAWSSPLLGSLAVLPVYAAARAVEGRGLALGAALLFALLPAAARFARVGDVDHHAAVALIGATWLALALHSLRPDARGRRITALAGGLCIARAALILVWGGSLLYLAVSESALLLAGVLTARRELLVAQAWSAAAAALLCVPSILAAGTPTGGPYATTSLSWLHPVALVAASATATGLTLLWRFWSREHSVARFATGGAVGLAVAGASLLTLPDLLESLSSAVEFFTKTGGWGPRVIEQQPLFTWLGEAPDFAYSRAHDDYGYLAYAIPLLPLAAVLRARDRRVRPPALFLALWCAVFGSLAVLQVRFGNDFAPAAAVGTALGLSLLGRALSGHVSSRLARSGVVLLGAALLWPGIAATYMTQARGALAILSRSSAAASTRLDGARSLVRFARTLREVTPDTSGFFDPAVMPEYGVLCDPSHGHVLHYVARRATPADNFGHYLDDAKFRAARDFYRTRDEASALAIARSHGARYVLSYDSEFLIPGSVVHRLQRLDGSARSDLAHLEHFRLIAEGPENGLPLQASFPSGRVPIDTVPYKLFEVVEGAVLEVQTTPGTEVAGGVKIATPGGRQFSYRASARAGGDGVARLRVAYATDTRESIRSLGPYQLRARRQSLSASVTDIDVLEGRTVRVESRRSAE